MPALEPGTPPSSQDPMASVPEVEEMQDEDTCPDPPEDISDDDSDFEH